MNTGTRIDETGMLLRDGGSFYLRRDAGGRFLLDLRRAPFDEVEKRVRIVGIHVGDGLVDVDGVLLLQMSGTAAEPGTAGDAAVSMAAVADLSAPVSVLRLAHARRRARRRS